MTRDYAPFQSKKIVLCANIDLKELIETYDSDVFDDFIWINRKRLLNEFWYRFKVLRQVKQLGAEVAIHPTYGREPYLGDCLMRATCAPQRIGREAIQNPYASNPKLINPYPAIADLCYTRLLKEDHHVTFDFYRNRYFFSNVLPGVPLPQNTRLNPIPVPVPEIPGPFAVMFPGASEAFREWPPECFAQVARYLFLTHGLRSIVLGSKADRVKGQAIVQAASDVPVNDFCGRLTLPQVVYLMSLCRIGLANDSGGVHGLAAVGKPGVAISNTYSFGFFHPYPQEISDMVSFVYPPAFYALDLPWAQRKEIYGRKKHFSITDVSTAIVIERIAAVLRGNREIDPIQASCDEASSS